MFFFDVDYKFPDEVLNNMKIKSLNLRFDAVNKNGTAGIYYVRLLKDINEK